jgi:hypothetical protein
MRRGQTEIIRDILLLIARGVSKPTRIMYGTNLAWDRLTAYLASIEAKGLVECREETKRVRYVGSHSEPSRRLSPTPRSHVVRRYVLTPKGEAACSLLHQLDGLFE